MNSEIFNLNRVLKADMGEALPAPSSAESRRATWRRLLKDGGIVIRRDWFLNDRPIRNPSMGGAWLSVKPECELPREFDLLYVTEATLIPCEVRWRRGDKLGRHRTFAQDPASSSLRP